MESAGSFENAQNNGRYRFPDSNLAVSHIGLLPEEVLFDIFSLFSFKERCNISLVSKQFCRLVFHDIRFRSICLQQFPSACNKQGVKNYANTNGWFKAFKLLSGVQLPIDRIQMRDCSAIDGNIMVTADTKGFEIWDLCTGKSLRSEEFPQSNFCKTLVALEGDRLVMSCSYPDPKEEYEFKSCLYLCNVKDNSKLILLADYNRNILTLAIKNGNIVTGDNEGVIDIMRRGKRKKGKNYCFRAHQNTVNSVFLENSFIASAGDGKVIKIWDWKGSRIRNLKGHERPIKCLSGNQNLIASGGKDKKLRVWDVESGNCLFIFPEQEDEIQEVVLQDNLVISVDHHRVQSLFFRSSQVIFAADGQRIRDANEEELRGASHISNAFLWDIKNEKLLKEYIVRPGIAMQGRVFLRKDSIQRTLSSLNEYTQHQKDDVSNCMLQ